MCPVEYPALAVRFEDVDGRLLGVCVESFQCWDGYFHSGRIEAWGGRAADQLINVESVTGSSGPCGGGDIAVIVVRSQWRSWAARV